MSVTQAFVNTATITPKTISVDATDHSPIRTSAATLTVLCSIQPRVSTEELGMGRDQAKKRAVMYFGSTTTAGAAFTLAQEDEVTVGGETYRVVGKPRDVAGRGVFLEADLEAESGG